MNSELNLSVIKPVSSPCKVATKFDIASILFGTITCLVYITGPLAFNKFLTNPTTTQFQPTKPLLANSRSNVFTQAGRATSRLKFVYSVTAANNESDKVVSPKNPNQNLFPARQRSVFLDAAVSQTYQTKPKTLDWFST